MWRDLAAASRAWKSEGLVSLCAWLRSASTPRWVATGVAAVVCGIVGGCTTPPTAESGKNFRRGPFAFEPLNVRNSCFVDSVHMYDAYLEKYHGEKPWARVLEWGNEEGDFKIGIGHAVTVFQYGDRLWEYDINYGFTPLKVGPDRRGDITDVTPEVFAKYPKSHQIFARYRDDYPQAPMKKPPEFLFYHKNLDVREATRVASELGKHRPVRVVEFDYPVNGQVQSSAAAIFVFGAKICVYFPRKGTHQSKSDFEGIDDLRYITLVLRHIFPGATNVRWQPGGYWLMPPKT